MKKEICDIPKYFTREQKIKALLGIADGVRKGWKSNLLEKDEIYNLIVISLINSVDSYNPNKGMKLSTFAYSNAQWAIKDALRNYGDTPLSLLKRGETIKLFYFSRKVGENQCLEDFIDRPYDTDFASEIIQNEERQIMYSCISQLPTMEKFVILKTLENRFTQREIAEQLNVSQARVGQIFKRGKSRLKEFVETEYGNV